MSSGNEEGWTLVLSRKKTRFKHLQEAGAGVTFANGKTRSRFAPSKKMLALLQSDDDDPAMEEAASDDADDSLDNNLYDILSDDDDSPSDDDDSPSDEDDSLCDDDSLANRYVWGLAVQAKNLVYQALAYLSGGGGPTATGGGGPAATGGGGRTDGPQGWDQVVVVSPKQEKVQIHSVRGRKYTEESLKECFPGSIHFIVNTNAHSLPSGKRGCLVCRDGIVGVVVQAREDRAIVQQLFPVVPPQKKPFILCDFWTSECFCLQQVTGSAVRPRPPKYLMMSQTPYAIPSLDSEETIRMEPSGPHIVQSASLASVDDEKMEKKLETPKYGPFLVQVEAGLQVEAGSQVQQQPKGKRQPRVRVLYVKDDCRTRLKTTKGHYLVHRLVGSQKVNEW